MSAGVFRVDNVNDFMMRSPVIWIVIIPLSVLCPLVLAFNSFSFMLCLAFIESTLVNQPLYGSFQRYTVFSEVIEIVVEGALFFRISLFG